MTNSNTFYQECPNCQFSTFSDFNTFECEKQVPFIQGIVCNEFLEIKSNEEKSLFATGKFNEVFEEIEKQEFIEGLENKTEIINVGCTNKIGESVKLDNRLLTLIEAQVYDGYDIRMAAKLHIEPANKMISFHRLVYRDGNELIMIKNKDNKKTYIQNSSKKVFICKQLRARNQPIDFLLISHKDFDSHCNSENLKQSVLEKKFEPESESFIVKNNHEIVVKIKEQYKRKYETLYRFNIISFTPSLPEVKIGRLSVGAKFYLAENYAPGKALKIITCDGTEGILLNEMSSFEHVNTAIEDYIDILTFIFIFSALILFEIRLLENGRFIFIGFIFALFVIFIKHLIANPLKMLLLEFAKRF